MLSIYKATKFLEILAIGGHTKPWVIEAEVAGCPQPFVMKVYTTQQIESQNCVTAEVIGNFLASEFDLPVPKAALIDVSSDEFQMSLSEEANFLLESKIDPRIKFGTEFKEPIRKADPELSKKIYANIELDTLYAFDNFIRNEDRGQNKTNLLIQDDTQEIWLIDHEVAFQGIDIHTVDTLIEGIKEGIWRETFTKYHFAYNYLKNDEDETKSGHFCFFMDFLRNLDLNKTNSYFNQLENYGYSTEKENIVKYLTFVKNNPTLFFTILKDSLR